MTCERCGKWAPADPETGYDADGICPECEEKEDTPCDGSSDDCDGIATVTVDTSDGYLKPEHFCASCLAAWKQRCEDGPGDPDGEDIFRDYAAESRDACAAAQRLK